MELADFGSPETIAQGIIDALKNMPVPVPIDSIARALDITSIEPLQTDQFEGGLITDRSKSEGIILVKGTQSDLAQGFTKRQRYTIGHELGHFLIPTHMPSADDQFLCTSGDMNQSGKSKAIDKKIRMEAEANRFAANILMPRRLFQAELRRSAAPDIDLLVRISQKFDVSKEAAARRFSELVDSPSAIIFSKDGVFRYALRSTDFPFLSLNRGSPLPHGTLTKVFSGADGQVSSMETVPATDWTDDKAFRIRNFLEQVLVQMGGHRLTLLQLDEDELEDDEYDAELEESYEVRFKR